VSNITEEVLSRLAQLDRDNGGTGSDYAVAKALGCSRATVSLYRTHPTRGMEDSIAIRAAELLKEDAGVLLAEIHAARSNSDGARQQWNRIAKLLKAEARIHAAA